MVVAGIVVAVVIAYLTMSWWMPRTWYRAMLYPGKRPNAIARRLNRVSAWAGAIGVAPTFMITLETKGRHSGKPSRVPLVVAVVGSERYLVSMLGDRADWVLNAQAALGNATMIPGDVERVKLVEVPATERAAILKAYLKRAPGARPHFDIDLDAPLAEFARVAPKYPVFRVTASSATA